jgi:hypothetical protein
MHSKWRKGSGGAFHDGLSTLDQIENIYAARGVVWHRLCEPMPAGLDEMWLV